MIWCQHLLGVVPDGKWGPKSKAACAAYQSQHGLEATGMLDERTVNALTDDGAHAEVAKVAPLLAANHDVDAALAEDFAEAA